MDKLEEIFDRQAKYLISLRPTYLHNGFLKHASFFPWELDDRHYQEEFRLLAWRFVEEIIEATETYEVYSQDKVVGREAFREEVSDALHFFIELCIVSGVTRSELLSGIAVNRTFEQDFGQGDSLDWIFNHVSMDVTVPNTWVEVIRALALAMMELRQRPWRTDFRPTHRGKWVMGLHLTFVAFITACRWSSITAKELHAAYFKKAQTNDKRREEFGA